MLYLLSQYAKTLRHVVEECVYIYHHTWSCATLESRPGTKVQIYLVLSPRGT